MNSQLPPILAKITPESRAIDLFERLWLFAVLLAGLCLYGFLSINPVHTDFLQYWTALQLASAGRNFYDATVVLSFQQLFDPQLATPTMYWGAPWLLVFLWPLGLLTLPVAFALMGILNVSAVVASLALLANANLAPQRLKTTAVCILAALFLPFELMFVAGQVSGLLVLGCCLVFVCFSQIAPETTIGPSFSRKVCQSLQLAAGLLLLSIKPHLFLPLIIAVGFRLVATKKLQLIFLLMFLIFSCIGALEVYAPGSMVWWLQSLSQPQAGAVSIYQWAAATPSFALRRFVAELYGKDLLWVQFIPALVSMLAVAIWAVLERGSERFLRVVLPWSIALGMLAAPYGWTFDLVVVLPWVVLGSRSTKALYGLALVGMVAFLLNVFKIVTSYDGFWWVFPLMVFVVLGASVIQWTESGHRQ